MKPDVNGTPACANNSTVMPSASAGFDAPSPRNDDRLVSASPVRPTTAMTAKVPSTKTE